MQWILNKLKSSFVLRVSLIFAVSAWVFVQIVRIVVSYFGFPMTVTMTIAELAVMNFLLVFSLAWVIRAASPPDRRLLVVCLAWILGPLVLGMNLFLLVIGSFFRGDDSSIFGWIILTLIVLVGFIWLQISGPFASVWLREKVEDREAVDKVVRKLEWPFKPDEIHEADAHISPKLYYTFLACILAIIFIVVESLLGEFLDDTFGSADYIGASIIALCKSAGFYPAHKRVSKYISVDAESSTGSIATNFKSAVSEVVRALRSLFKMIIRYWYVFVPLSIVTGYVMRWIIRHSGDIFLL